VAESNLIYTGLKAVQAFCHSLGGSTRIRPLGGKEPRVLQDADVLPADVFLQQNPVSLAEGSLQETA